MDFWNLDKHKLLLINAIYINQLLEANIEAAHNEINSKNSIFLICGFTGQIVKKRRQVMVYLRAPGFIRRFCPYLARVWIRSYFVIMWYSPNSSLLNTAPFCLEMRLLIFSTDKLKGTTGYPDSITEETG